MRDLVWRRRRNSDLAELGWYCTVAAARYCGPARSRGGVCSSHVEFDFDDMMWREREAHHDMLWYDVSVHVWILHQRKNNCCKRIILFNFTAVWSSVGVEWNGLDLFRNIIDSTWLDLNWTETYVHTHIHIHIHLDHDLLYVRNGPLFVHESVFRWTEWVNASQNNTPRSSNESTFHC